MQKTFPHHRSLRETFLLHLKADCGTYLGWAIDPEKVEATGFTNTINDYRYEEYLEAWVD